MDIYEQNPEQLAKTIVRSIERLGQHGLPGREALQKELTNTDYDEVDLREGMAQLEDALT